MSTANQPPRIFDEHLSRNRLSRAAVRGYPDFLIEDVADEISARFGLVNRKFENVAVIAHDPHQGLARHLAGTGRCERLVRISPVASPGVQIVTAQDRLPLAPASFDAVVWVFGPESLNDPAGALLQLREALRPDGLMIAATLGAGSLGELRNAWFEAELEARGGASPRVAPFADVRELGALLQRAGFSLPVADRSNLTVLYSDPMKLMQDLKALGWSNALAGRSRVPVTRGLFDAACSRYVAAASTADGRVRATFEIVYLTGWSPHPDQQKPLRPGSARQRLADALSVKEHPLRR